MTTPNFAIDPTRVAASPFAPTTARDQDHFPTFDAPRRADRVGMSFWERRAREAMANETDTPVSLERVARQCGMSQRSFTRRFKECTGKTPHQWLISQRLAKAKRLLLARMPLVEVAQACGFADQSHFTRTFARSVGHPPGRWLRLHGD